MIYSALGMFTLNSESILFIGERENDKNRNTSCDFESGFESASYNVAKNLLIKHTKRKTRHLS